MANLSRTKQVTHIPPTVTDTTYQQVPLTTLAPERIVRVSRPIPLDLKQFFYYQKEPLSGLATTDAPNPLKRHPQAMDNANNDSSTSPILTETMAQLLLDQRHWREAIDIYRKLGRQNPEKAKVYQKEISQIKEYFRPQTNPETIKKRLRSQQQIARLKNLLKVVEQQQPGIRKQRSS